MPGTPALRGGIVAGVLSRGLCCWIFRCRVWTGGKRKFERLLPQLGFLYLASGRHGQALTEDHAARDLEAGQLVSISPSISSA